DHLMSLSQKGRYQLVEARAVGPQAVDEDDAGFAMVCQRFDPFVSIAEDVIRLVQASCRYPNDEEKARQPRHSRPSFAGRPVDCRNFDTPGRQLSLLRFSVLKSCASRTEFTDPNSARNNSCETWV